MLDVKDEGVGEGPEDTRIGPRPESPRAQALSRSQSGDDSSPSQATALRRCKPRGQEAESPAFQQEMHIRAGVEGTTSEPVRVHRARRARYPRHGQEPVAGPVHCQAANLKWLAWAVSVISFSTFCVDSEPQVRVAWLGRQGFSTASQTSCNYGPFV